MKKQIEETPKKPSYRQLEKHVNNGREMVFRITQEMMKQEKAIKIIKGQLLSAQAIIGVLVTEHANNTEDGRKDGVTVSKALISELIDKYTLIWEETEDRLGFNFKVIERAWQKDENEAETEASNENM